MGGGYESFKLYLENTYTYIHKRLEISYYIDIKEQKTSQSFKAEGYWLNVYDEWKNKIGNDKKKDCWLRRLWW